jgi:dTMP kinase
MKGRFIVLDGNDGSGKATQAALLSDYFGASKISCQKMDFPAYETNFFGALVGECLAGKHGDFVHMDPKVASTLYALDRLESTPLIKSSLEEGKVVVADRFTSSNQIHQGGKIADTKEREVFLGWLDRMEHEVLGIPRPDAIIYLRVPVEISLKLLSEKRKAKNTGLGDGQKDTVEEDRNYLERSHEAANWLASHQKNWHIIDCVKDGDMRTREDIHAEIVLAIATISVPLAVSA